MVGGLGGLRVVNGQTPVGYAVSLAQGTDEYGDGDGDGDD